MGADRKGPLAAFILIAIIAAILLVTSVRSQAATGWIRSALPSTPAVARAVGDGVDQVVEGGAVLVQRSTVHSLPTADPDTASPAPDVVAPPATDVVHHATRHPATDHGTAGHHHEAGHEGRGRHPAGSGAAPHDHGRHLGWTHGHGHDKGRPGHGLHLGWDPAHRG